MCDTEDGKKSEPCGISEPSPPALPNKTTSSGEREQSKGGRFFLLNFDQFQLLYNKKSAYVHFTKK